MVTEPFAFQRNVTQENNTITLLTEAGEQTFTIGGVYYDYGSDQGVLLMDLAVYRQYFDDPYITSAALFVEDDADINTIIDTLRTEVLVGSDWEVRSNRELREGALAIFDRTFAITYALQILAVIVAFIGILSALLALQLEHKREYGIMRANGMTPGQLRKFTLVQTGLMGLVSGLMSIPLGMVLAVAIVAALLAGIYPALRLSNLVTAEAIRGE
jgi:putative ABC transport system permease protein